MESSKTQIWRVSFERPGISGLRTIIANTAVEAAQLCCDEYRRNGVIIHNVMVRPLDNLLANDPLVQDVTPIPMEAKNHPVQSLMPSRDAAYTEIEKLMSAFRGSKGKTLEICGDVITLTCTIEEFHKLIDQLKTPITPYG